MSDKESLCRESERPHLDKPRPMQGRGIAIASVVLLDLVVVLLAITLIRAVIGLRWRTS
jgi:hypothetical protein